ncbi:hypothetical protein FQZ97_1001820 [compost metagenome]
MYQFPARTYCCGEGELRRRATRKVQRALGHCQASDLHAPLQAQCEDRRGSYSHPHRLDQESSWINSEVLVKEADQDRGLLDRDWRKACANTTWDILASGWLKMLGLDLVGAQDQLAFAFGGQVVEALREFGKNIRLGHESVLAMCAKRTASQFEGYLSMHI